MEIDWRNKDWSYLLGVVHGDGSIKKRNVEIFVGYHDLDYADVLCQIWEVIGYSPKQNRQHSCMAIRVNNIELVNTIRKYKQKGIWAFPDNLNQAEYLSGIFDTDGCVSKPQHNQLILILKRSGNLVKVAEMLTNLGFRDIYVKNTKSKWRNEEYLTETIRICGWDRILQFQELVGLRHPRKKQRFEKMINFIEQQINKVRWLKIAEWLKNEPKTVRDIMKEFNLTKEQASVDMTFIKHNCKVRKVPPPKLLTKYRVLKIYAKKYQLKQRYFKNDGGIKFFLKNII